MSFLDEILFNIESGKKDSIFYNGKWFCHSILKNKINYYFGFLNHLFSESKAVAVLYGEKTVNNICLIIALWKLDIPVLLMPVSLKGTEKEKEIVSSIQGSKIHFSGEDLVLSDIRTSSFYEDSMALCLPTSGTTGSPKLIPIYHHSIDTFSSWAGRFLGINSDTTCLSFAPINFDLSLLEIWSTLSLGGKVVLFNEGLISSREYLVQIIETISPNLIQGVPILFKHIQKRMKCIKTELQPIWGCRDGALFNK